MHILRGAFFIAALAFGTPIGVAAGADDLSWRIVGSTGEIQTRTSDLVSVAVDPTAPLPDGTVVMTGASGRAVLRRGLEQIVLSPNSRVRLSRGDLGVRILQEQGSALFSVGKRAVPHFEVDTPYLAAVVKGTAFAISVDGNGASVSVSEGSVEVATPWRDAVTLVKAGGTARVMRNRPDEIDVSRGGVTRAVSVVEGVAPADSGLRLAAAPQPAGNLFAASSGGGIPSGVSGGVTSHGATSHGAVSAGAASRAAASAGLRPSESSASASEPQAFEGLAVSDAPGSFQPASAGGVFDRGALNSSSADFHAVTVARDVSEVADVRGAVPVETLSRPVDAASSFVNRQAHKVVKETKRAAARARHKAQGAFPLAEVLIAGVVLLAYVFGTHIFSVKHGSNGSSSGAGARSS